MKTSIALFAATALVAKSYASSCWSEKYGYECCSPSFHPYKTIDYRQGIWSIENNNWCGILNGGVDASKPCWSHKLRYPCCSRLHNIEVLADENGSWGIENGDWCGVVEDKECWANELGYPCCANNTTKVEFENSSYKWGLEDGIWCGIIGEKEKEIPVDYSIQGENPFKNKFYINPNYEELVDLSIKQMSDRSLIQKAENVKKYSNAIWLNYISIVEKEFEFHLKNALEEQETTGEKILTVFVLNNIPGSDCTKELHQSEFLTNKTDMGRYKEEYIDYIESIVKKYNQQPIVFLVEPSTFTALISTSRNPDCAEAEDYYYEGVAYAIQKLGVLPNVALYLDIGYYNITGYDDNRDEAIKIYKKILQAGSPGTVRGFFSNVGRYGTWSEPTLTRGPETEWNPNPDEERFIAAMHKDLVNNNMPANFIVDTSRNGMKVEVSPGEWCNLKGAGAGPRPEAEPIKGMDYLDAFYWVKQLGISDGTSDATSAQYDPYCAHYHSMKPSPKFYEWFQSYFEECIMYANPPL